MKKIMPMAGFIGFLVETIFRPSQKYCLTTSENVKDMVRKYELECDKFKLERSAYFLGHCVYSSNDYRVNRITEQADAIFLFNRNPNIFKDVTKSILEQLKKIIDFDHDRKIASFIQKILDCLMLIESCDYEKTEVGKLSLYDIRKKRLKYCAYCNEYMHEDRFCSSASHTLRLNEKDILTPVTCSYMFRKAVFCNKMRELFLFTFIDLDNFITNIKYEKVGINTLRQVLNSKEKPEELVENTNVFVGFHKESKKELVLDSSKKEFKHAECSSLLINPETQAKKTTDIITILAAEEIKSDNKSEFIKQNLEENKINVMEKENKIKSKEEHKESTEKEKGQFSKEESKKSDMITKDVKPFNQTDELKPVEAVLQNKLIEPGASAILPSVTDQMENHLFERMQEAYGSEEGFYSVTQNKEELESNNDESKNDNDNTLPDLRYYRTKNVKMADIIRTPDKEIKVQSTEKNFSKKNMEKRSDESKENGTFEATESKLDSEDKTVLQLESNLKYEKEDTSAKKTLVDPILSAETRLLIMDPEEEVTIEPVSTEEDKLEYCLIEREYLQIPKEEELKLTGNVKKQSENDTLLPDTKKEESRNEEESINNEQWNEIEKMKNKLKETEKRIDDLERVMENCLEMTEKIKKFILSDEMNKEKPIKEKLTGVFAVKGDENKSEPTEQLSEEKETGTRKIHESTKKGNDPINCNQGKENVFVETNQDKEEDLFLSRKVGLIFIYFVVFCLYLLYALFQS